MRLFIFNPEHEISLAYDRDRITMPHIVRQFRHDLAYLPALWAADGDAVLVDDIVSARKMAQKWIGDRADNIVFVTLEEVGILQFDMVIPWGWDKSLCRQLLDAGFDDLSLPDDLTLSRIRDMSNRLQTILMMSELRYGLEDQTVGEPHYCTTMEELRAQLFSYQECVIKAPWSSSGRGVKYVKAPIDLPIVGWCRNTLERQGGIVVEPYYKKVKDFAMEFYSDGHGRVEYRGLSIFNTSGSAYSSNMLATEAVKEKLLTKYVSRELLQEIRQRICNVMGMELENVYAGPFGVDMMIVKGGLLNPCVEINLRMTMGHLALCLSPDDDEVKESMMITRQRNGFKLVRRLRTKHSYIAGQMHRCASDISLPTDNKE